MAAALAILGGVGGFAGPAIEVAKSIAAPVGRQFSYLCCFRSNIKTLNDEAKTLEDETSGLQAKVDAASNNAHLIFPHVETWLSNSEEMQKGINGILREAPDMERGCLKLRERYSLSRKAKKKANAIKKLVEKCKFNDDTISYPPAPAASAPVESATKAAYEFESRREVEDEIMKSLKDKKVYKIGIAGMGGLGKTTMARKIMHRARGEGLFEEAVMAVVSQPVDKLNIQLQIGEQLGVTTFKEITTLIPRAHILRERLRGNKRTLLVLDDVWEKNLDMEELGIPCEDGCKVLLTSRDKGVFKAMDVKEIRELKILDEREAWILFRDKAGICVDDDALLNTIARDVMRECKGLPLALAIVGKALEGVNNKASWKDALEQLQKHNPSDIEDVIQLVYNPLKLSYDRLGNENAKSMLLLCCLFAEDYNIPLEHLTYFAMGLQWFEKDWDLERVRGRICTLIENLKSRCLLLDGYNKDHVRMHDVVRDVSIFIASKELKQVKCRSSCTTCTGRCTCPCTCTWISSHVDGGARHVPPHQSCFPKLKLLLMNDEVEDEMDNLIGGSTGLNVLFINRYNLIKSLLALKMSLTTLVLLSCDSLESIAVVGQLESLEILIFRSCHSIKELPEQAKGLKRLKLLKISRCEKLKRIAAGVISSMVALEELKIVDSFNDWKGGEIDEERNDEASFREIESLKKLRCLKIDVSNFALAAQPLSLSFDKLVQFKVRFGRLENVYGGHYQQSYQRRMYLHSRNESDIIDFGDLSANIFLTRAECLSICARAENNQDFNLNLATVQNLRWLNLEGFTNKKNITSAAVAAASFHLLVFLRLDELCNLEEIWDDAPIPSNSFNNLEGLNLVGLRALKRMGKCVLSTANDLFLQLESITIQNCKEMEHLLVLVPNEEEQDKEDHSTVLIFPKLKTMHLDGLPKLTNLICSRGIESIQFPLLADMRIEGYCENLKWLVSRDDDGDHYKDDHSLHLFCNSKVSFPNLKKLILECNVECKNVWCDKIPMGFFTGLVDLYIESHEKIRRLFSSSSKIPQNLVSLRFLDIGGCDEMVKVIEDDEEVSSSSSSCDHPTNPTTPLFPSLQVLWLYRLPKLESFCEWRRCADLELPSLKTLRIDGCPEMKSFNAGAGSIIITPALQTVTINGQDLESVDDLNAALHQHFQEAKVTTSMHKSTFLQDLECGDDLNAALHLISQEQREQMKASWDSIAEGVTHVVRRRMMIRLGIGDCFE